MKRAPLASVARLLLAAAALGLASAPVCAGQSARNPCVLCHYTYGGEEKRLWVDPVASPYRVEPVAVGSYFQFKVVFQTAPRSSAGIRVYVSADREPVPVPIHQANFPYPVRMQSSGYGFTGQHWVYEPVRDGEMQYWCEMKKP